VLTRDELGKCDEETLARRMETTTDEHQLDTRLARNNAVVARLFIRQFTYKTDS